MKLFLLFLFSFLLINTPVFTQNDVPIDDEYTAWLEEFGFTDGNYYNNFVLESTNWNPVSNAPSPFGRAVIGKVGDYVYVFASQNATSLAIALHLPTSTWVNSTPCQFPGFNSGFCVANNEVYKLSGSTSTTQFEKFTPAGNGTGTWSTLPSAPTVVNTAQNGIVWDGGNFIYAYSSGTTSPYPSYLYAFNLTTQTWEQKASSIYPRRYAGMASVNGIIYLIGGLKSDASNANVNQKYDPSTNTWSEIAPLPEDMNFTKWCVTTDGRFVFLAGHGGGYSTFPVSNNFYYYDPELNIWSLEGPVPATRGLVQTIYLSGHQKLFWGGGNDGTAGTTFQSNVWIGEGGVLIPVELTSFTANVSGNNVILNWVTATEKNNMGFEVQKSEVGKQSTEWEVVGFVNGNGTTIEIKAYSFIENNISSGVYNYRLKQIDFVGSYEYSNVIEVDIVIPNEFSLNQNYPNPFNPSTVVSYQLSVDSKVNLIVYDILGNEVVTLVNDFQSAGKYNINFSATNLSSGVYYYTLRAGEFVTTKKMLLMK